MGYPCISLNVIHKKLVVFLSISYFVIFRFSMVSCALTLFPTIVSYTAVRSFLSCHSKESSPKGVGAIDHQCHSVGASANVWLCAWTQIFYGMSLMLFWTRAKVCALSAYCLWSLIWKLSLGSWGCFWWCQSEKFTAIHSYEWGEWQTLNVCLTADVHFEDDCIMEKNQKKVESIKETTYYFLTPKAELTYNQIPCLRGNVS